MDNLQEYQYVRANVIMEGNGDIWTKPGKLVYGGDLKEKHESNATA